MFYNHRNVSLKMLSQRNSISQSITENPFCHLWLLCKNRMEFTPTVRGQAVINQNSLVPLMLFGLKDEQNFPSKWQIVTEQSDFFFPYALIGCNLMLLPGTLSTLKPGSLLVLNPTSMSCTISWANLSGELGARCKMNSNLLSLQCIGLHIHSSVILLTL